jgi:pyrroline-5-carboxylate reductase
MGKMLAAGWLRSKALLPSELRFVERDPKRTRDLEQELGITGTSLKELVRESSLLVICVRPPEVESLLVELRGLFAASGSRGVVSIAAGLPFAFYRKGLGRQAPLARVMPNIGVQQGEGMSLCAFSPDAPAEFKGLVHRLFKAVGEAVDLSEEAMDWGCAVAGSGPAFALRLIDAAAKTGEGIGLSYDDRLRIAAQTFLGAAKLLMAGGKPDALLAQIATPQGTTEAGLKALHALDGASGLRAAIAASAARSREISQGNDATG